MSSIQILLVDDYKAWRHEIRTVLQARPEWCVICEASDGLEAVRKTEELKPDLILLDIGLPELNGIEAARRMRRVSSSSKIIFVSQENSPEVVQEALSTGAKGYVYKARAHSELLTAVDAVLRGEQFVTSVLKGFEVTDTSRAKFPQRPRRSVLIR
jgi:DNA-binding NarL/FixJ family response regulator